MLNRIWVSTEYSLEELIDSSFDVTSPFPKTLRDFISEYFRRAILYYKYPEKYQEEIRKKEEKRAQKQKEKEYKKEILE